jgi:hypothetical protein
MGSLHNAGEHDGDLQPVELVVERDALLDHHIEEILIAFGDLARRQQDGAPCGERPID